MSMSNLCHQLMDIMLAYEDDNNHHDVACRFEREREREGEGGGHVSLHPVLMALHTYQCNWHAFSTRRSIEAMLCM